ncbi:MAG: GEVED domain-containing protein, partial [Bacteroidota bacterium]
GSFTVPSTALTGSTRMRVIMSDAAISSPCGTVNYGEVEDYTVNIQTVSGTTCNAPANLSTSNLTSSTVTLNWGAVSGASGYSVQVKTSAASTWTTYSATTNTLSLTGLTGSTTYNWQVRTNCTSGSSGYTTGSNFTTPAATSCTDNYETNNTLSAAKTIPVNTNLTARIGTSTDIDWFKFTNTSAQKNIRVTISNLPFDYDLYLYNSAGTLLSSSENGGTTSELVKYNNGAVGTYYVRVRGYNGAFSGTACYTINASISSTAFRFDVHQEDELLSEGEESLVVYPNPSITGLFTCNLESAVNGMFTMQVTDASGRVLETREVNKQDGFLKTDINVSGYSNGIYYVRFLGDGVIMNEKLLYLER